MESKTFIYSADGRMLGVGRSLDILMQHARKRGGVLCVLITNIQHGAAKVEVRFAKGGVYGQTTFDDAKDAVEWACKLSDDRRSAWSLAHVVHYDGTVGGITLRGVKNAA
jgi:hypothetical protein